MGKTTALLILTAWLWAGPGQPNTITNAVSGYWTNGGTWSGSVNELNLRFLAILAAWRFKGS
jgi:hypothetical protein